MTDFDLHSFRLEKMNGSASIKQKNPDSVGSLTMSIVDFQTSAENGRKFTKYKATINHNGRIWDVWHRYSEFNSLHDKVRFDFLCRTEIERFLRFHCSLNQNADPTNPFRFEISEPTDFRR